MASSLQGMAREFTKINQLTKIAFVLGIVLGIIGVWNIGPFSKNLVLAPGLAIATLFKAIGINDLGILKVIAVVGNGIVFGLFGGFATFIYEEFIAEQMKLKVQKVAVAAFVFLVIGLVALSHLQYEKPFAATASDEKTCPVSRPYFGSVNCVVDQTETQTTKNIGEVFQCTYDDHQCQLYQIKYPVEALNLGGDCPWNTITWGVSITDTGSGQVIWPTNCNLLNFQSCLTSNLPVTLSRGDSYKLDVWCNTFGGGVVKPNHASSWQAQFQSYGEHYVVNFDSGNSVPIAQANTGCKYNDLWTSYYGAIQPNKDVIRTIQDAALGAVDFVTGKGGSDIPSNTKGSSQEIPQDSQAGDAYWIVTDWVERPSLILEKKDGNYVWCNAATNTLVQMQTVESVKDECFTIPYKRLGQVECCDTAWCRARFNDASYTCDSHWTSTHEPTFTCVKSGTTCPRGDYDCSAVATTCRQDPPSGKFLLTKTGCLNTGYCGTEDTEVSCCTGTDGGPNICGKDAYCDYAKGCMPITRDCPAGGCCQAPKYKATLCPTVVSNPCLRGINSRLCGLRNGIGKQCCPTDADPYLGWCADSCGGERKCSNSTDCLATESCTEGKCTPLLCQSGEVIEDHKCTSSKFPLLWMLIFGALGAVLSSYAVEKSKMTSEKKTLTIIGVSILMALVPFALASMNYPLPNIEGQLFSCPAAQPGQCKGITDILCQMFSFFGNTFGPVVYGVVIVGAIFAFVSTFSFIETIFPSLEQSTRSKVQWIVSLIAAIAVAKFICNIFWWAVILVTVYYLIAKLLLPTVVRAAEAKATLGASEVIRKVVKKK